jgi:hypothetical protein
MNGRCKDVGGVRLFECAEDGAQLSTERDATEVLGAAWGERAAFVAIPTARLHPDFFRLETRMAGAFLQKFVTYQMRVAIVGNMTEHLQRSTALRDFVRESNKGDQIWFLESMDELGMRFENR